MRQPAGLLPAPPSPARSAAVAAGLYAAVGTLWIVASDWVLFQLSPGPEAFATLQTWKGTLFVLVTAGFLFVLLRFQFARRARAAGELKAANQRLASHVENTPLALIEFDQEFRVSRWSKRAEDVFGWSAAEVLGKRWSDWGFVPPEDLPEVERIINESLEAGESGSFSVNRNLRRDGQVIWCEWYNSWLRGGDGNPTSMMSLAHDVTDELEATREVRRLNLELEARVHRRTEELAQANADLRALSYSISHDLRAPVRAILGFGEIIRRRHGEALPEEGRRYVGNILTAGEQMDRLIDGLLEYGKLDSEKVSREVVDLGRVIDEVVEELRAADELASTGVEVVGAIPLVTADPQGLRRVVQNLLGNAWKYRAPDRDWRVRISGEADGSRVLLRVSDNGPGIAEEHRERVFELFERLHSQEEVAGAGLGLAVVRRLMELMGGTVSIGDHDPSDSAVVEGVTFVLTFRPAETNHEHLGTAEMRR